MQRSQADLRTDAGMSSTLQSFPKQPLPEQLPLMSESIHQINTEKQNGNSTLTSEILKIYP